MQDNKPLLYLFLIALGILGVFTALSGNIDLTGFATTPSTTITTVSNLASGASFKRGETFSITAQVACENFDCDNVVSHISLPNGLSLASGGSEISLGKINNGKSASASYLVYGKEGNYNIKLTSTSLNSAASSTLIGITVFVPACSSNADCGKSQYMTADYCGLDANLYRDYQSETCKNAGTISAYCLSEVLPVLSKICNHGCENAQCNEGPKITAPRS